MAWWRCGSNFSPDRIRLRRPARDRTPFCSALSVRSAPAFSVVERYVAGRERLLERVLDRQQVLREALDRVLVRLGDVGLRDLADVVGLGLGAQPGVLHFGHFRLDARQLRRDVVGDMGHLTLVDRNGRRVAGCHDVGRGVGLRVLVGHANRPRKGAVVAIRTDVGVISPDSTPVPGEAAIIPSQQTLTGVTSPQQPTACRGRTVPAMLIALPLPSRCPSDARPSCSCLHPRSAPRPGVRWTSNPWRGRVPSRSSRSTRRGPTPPEDDPSRSRLYVPRRAPPMRAPRSCSPTAWAARARATATRSAVRCPRRSAPSRSATCRGPD